VHILGVTERPVEAPSSPFGGARSPDSVANSLFQTLSLKRFSETQRLRGHEKPGLDKCSISFSPDG
jgi:hypothetical protein